MEITDPKWELVDPHPDVFGLFVEFSRTFFGNKLGSVQLMWSKRMKSCAGICYFSPSNRECTIRLSEPLLKFRPRSDLIETLLHEMIHAYLYITNNNSDRDDHGPEFQKIMRQINMTTGANITIFHTFNDEVESYKVHIWQCEGPCRFRQPYFGIVRRSMNRQPGKYDSWWEKHQITCGGQFVKTAGPKSKAEIKSDAKSLKEANEENRKLEGGTVIKGTDPTKSKSVKNVGLKGYFPVVDSSFLPRPSPSLDSIVRGKKSTEALGWFTGVSISEAPKLNATLWSGTGNQLGFGEAGPRQSPIGTRTKPKETYPCATITSGALTSEEKKAAGPEEASCSFKYGELGAIPKQPKNKQKFVDLTFGQRDQAFSLQSFSSTFQNKLQDNVVECPVCCKSVPSLSINTHLDDHYGLTSTEGNVLKKDEGVSSCEQRDQAILKSLQKNLPTFQIRAEDKGSMKCPICSKFIPSYAINSHLDTHFEPDLQLGNSGELASAVGSVWDIDESMEDCKNTFSEVIQKCVLCPICFVPVQAKEMNNHMNICAVGLRF